MALLYAAELSPTKPELIRHWLLQTSYYTGEAPTIEQVGAYRFDDPAGEVGIETHLVRTGAGAVYQVPLTYRSAPLPGARAIGEMEHSVLGRRYIYDATTDPVYVQQLLVTVYGGGHEAEQYVHVEGGEPKKIDNTACVRGSGLDGVEAPVVASISVVADGDDTVIEAEGIVIAVHHRPADIDPIGPVLVGEWGGGRGVLATVRSR